MAKWGLRHFHVILLVGVAILGLLNAIDVAMQKPFWSYTVTIRMEHESNVPSWLTSVLLFCAATMSFRCYRLSVEKKVFPSYGFLLTSLVMVVLSCDEVAEVHERFGELLSRRLFSAASQAVRHTDWTVTFGPLAVVVACGLAFVFHRHMHRSRRALLTVVAGLGLGVAMAVGLESLTNLLDKQRQQWLWDLEVICEEVGEMVGAWMISFGLMLHGDNLAATSSASDFDDLSETEVGQPNGQSG